MSAGFILTITAAIETVLGALLFRERMAARVGERKSYAFGGRR